MKKSFIIKVFLIVFTGLLHAQNMSISAGNVTAIRGDTVLVPVNISNAVNMAAITLKIQFNSSALLWKDAVNWNSQLSGAAAGADANVLSINWIGLEPSASQIQISRNPERAELKAIFRPSGE